jgi:hypothetical protein
MTTTAHLLSIGRRRPGEVWTRQGRRFCCITSLMLVTTVGQSRRGTSTWPLRSSCDKHHARTETRGTQGDRRTTLWPARLADWLPHLADRADLGDLRTTGMALAVGRLLALVLRSQQDFILPVYTHHRSSPSTSVWDDVRI